MTAGRKPAPTKDLSPIPVNEDLVREDMSTSAELGTLSRFGEDAVRLGHALGRIETADFYRNVSDAVRLEAYEDAKKTKAYLSIINPKTETYFASLEEFCECRIGFSSRRIQQIASNRSLLGKELYDQGQRLGLRQIDYNAIKALPAPDQEMMRRAVDESASRDEVLDILQELATRNAIERAALAKEAADAKAIAEDKDGRIKEVQEENEKLREERAKRTRYTPDQAAKEASGRRAERMQALNDAALSAMDAINEFGIVLADVSTDGDDRDQGMNTARWLAQQISNLYVNHQIDVDFAETITPTWTKAAKS